MTNIKKRKKSQKERFVHDKEHDKLTENRKRCKKKEWNVSKNEKDGKLKREIIDELIQITKERKNERMNEW